MAGKGIVGPYSALQPFGVMDKKLEELGRFWMSFIDALRRITDDLTQEWPEELPPQGTPEDEAFWMAACREEMRTRQTLSAKIQALLVGKAHEPMTVIESWLLRRRVEWASQLGMAKVGAGVLPPVPLHEVLVWALVTTWETDGCQGLWLHAERGGKKHPEAADWLPES